MISLKLERKLAAQVPTTWGNLPTALTMTEVE
jgi:hypothetical protein